LGLALSVISAVAIVELFPHLTINREPAIEAQNRIPSFAVRNDGYLAVRRMELSSYLFELETSQGFRATDVAAFRNNLQKPIDLEPGQTATIGAGQRAAGVLTKVDIGIIVSFRPWPFLFWHSRKYYRYVAHPQGDKLVWYEQPFGEVSPALAKELDDNGL
jgi:hypothetical protein